MVPRKGVEPSRIAAADFESAASAYSATSAYNIELVPRAGLEPAHQKARDFLTTITFVTQRRLVCGLDFAFTITTKLH